MKQVKTPAQADQVSEIVAADADSGRLENRKGSRRQIERRAPKPASNVRYEDKDKPAGWRPKRIKRGETK
jgi:hypothetical protein